MHETVSKLRKSKKKWAIMATPKKPEVPEVAKPDWLFIIIASISTFIVLLLGYKILDMKEQYVVHIVHHEQEVKRLDKLLRENEQHLASHRNRMAQDSATFMNDKAMAIRHIEHLEGMILELKETVEKLEVENQNLKEAKPKVEPQAAKPINKKSTRVHGTRSSNVVRPRVYDW